VLCQLFPRLLNYLIIERQPSFNFEVNFTRYFIHLLHLQIQIINYIPTTNLDLLELRYQKNYCFLVKRVNSFE